ncbi:hypothetical protein CHARACLAT_012492 [Characodon lateralis]|uniref:Uncharacterized protein n=1 Tax=Characodon lateralis TaxID=208331 RepID=A0ABU7ET42_9TELE|nr:hypothetical protein [Characodon lateralis]
MVLGRPDSAARSTFQTSSTHHGTPDPTPRWDKLTRQEVNSQWQARWAGVPHKRNHTNIPHHRLPLQQ